MARSRFYTALLALFAGVALALAATGIFGVMSYTVAQRAKEISIRMALGARAGQVLGAIVGRAVTLAAAGAILGLGGALALGRVIESQLFGVKLFDPLTLGGCGPAVGRLRRCRERPAGATRSGAGCGKRLTRELRRESSQVVIEATRTPPRQWRCPGSRRLSGRR